MIKELSTSIASAKDWFGLQTLLWRSKVTAILELNQETTRDKSTINIKQGDLTALKLS